MTTVNGTVPWRFILVAGALAILATGLTVHDGLRLLPLEGWSRLLADAPASPVEAVARYSFAPRIVVALLVGAALALAGTLLQRALRNPLAEPTTVGASAGAGLALSLATLFAPALLDEGREVVAFVGAAGATAAVFGIAARDRFSPVTLILAGLVVSLTIGAANAMLLTLSAQYVRELFIWQSGSLIQDGDVAATALAWRLGLAAVVTLLLARPLALLELGDSAVSSLGVSPMTVRLAALALATGLAGSVAAYVGVFGFVGLAAPAFARWTGARTFAEQSIRAPAIGALLLLMVDRLAAAFAGGEFPTGVATALLGAPLLLILLPSTRASLYTVSQSTGARRTPEWAIPAILIAVWGLAVVALCFGPSTSGWGVLSGASFEQLAPFRWPRILTALSSGALLALAGVVMQRVTGNPAASPEALGVSAGAALGVLVVLAVAVELDRAVLGMAAAAGAMIAMLTSVAVAGRSISADRLLLAGFSLTALATAFASLTLSLGDPRTQWILTWLSGSTYSATSGGALSVAAAAVVALFICPTLVRWLDTLPLGRSVATAVGVSAVPATTSLFAFAALCTAVATLAIGPLSFVGMIAPHIARLAGFRRAATHMIASAAIGAALLVIADWIGRSAIYPWQIPAGTITALLGGAYLLLLLRTRT